MSELMKQALATCGPEEKAQLLAELATEIFETRGALGYSIQNSTNKTVGYLTPDTVHPGTLIPDDPAWRATIQTRADMPGPTLSLDQFLDGITEEPPTGR